MLRLLLSAMLTALLGTLCSAQTGVDTGVSEVPFAFDSGLVIVEAKIKGNVPVQVALSTGVEYSIVDARLMDRYKLQGYYASDGPVTGRNDSTYSFTKVPGVSVGGSKAKEVDMRYGSMSHVNEATGREIFAALGADFFEGQVVQFDFKKKVVRFLDKSPAKELKDKDGRAPQGAPVVLRMAEKASNPYVRTFFVPVVEDVTFNGQKVKLLLDTGRASSLAFSSAAAKKAGFALPAEDGSPLEDKVKSLRLGEYEMSDVPATLYPKGTNVEKTLSKYGVVAGTVFLQNFITTFDFRSKYVILERA
jgi:hypothetical protein